MFKSGKNFSLFISNMLVLFFSSCKKDNDTNLNPTPEPNPNSFPAVISNIVPQTMIDSIRATGAAVYAGSTPAIVNGIYLMHPDSCVYDNSPGNFTGTIFTDYKFRFSNQDNTLFTLTVDQKSIPAGVLSSTPVSTYISGTGNNFSIFLLRTVSPGGVTVQQFNVLSGTLTSTGIQGLQNTLYLRSKGSDPTNSLPPAGTIRRFINGGNGLAANATDF